MQTLPAVNTLIRTADFTITTDGAGFVSQPTTAALCGVTKQAISKLLKRGSLDGCRFILNDNSQLDEKTLVLVVGHYATKGNKVALESAKKFMQAGIRAYIYGAAGYTATQQASARIAELENAVALLSADRHRTEAKTAVANTENLKTTIHNQHATLQNWVAQGYLDCDAKTRTEYKYFITDHGKLHGFQQNRNGTVLPPLEWIE